MDFTVYWIPRRSLSSGGASVDPLAGHDGFLCPLPLPLNKALHQPVRLVGQERSPEDADAEVDGFLERQLFPLPEQGFLRTQRFRTAFEQGFDRALDRGIEAALRGNHVNQPPG